MQARSSAVEQWTFNPLVQGSNPCGPTRFLKLGSAHVRFAQTVAGPRKASREPYSRPRPIAQHTPRRSQLRRERMYVVPRRSSLVRSDPGPDTEPGPPDPSQEPTGCRAKGHLQPLTRNSRVLIRQYVARASTFRNCALNTIVILVTISPLVWRNVNKIGLGEQKFRAIQRWL